MPKVMKSICPVLRLDEGKERDEIVCEGEKREKFKTHSPDQTD